VRVGGAAAKAVWVTNDQSGRSRPFLLGGDGEGQRYRAPSGDGGSPRTSLPKPLDMESLALYQRRRLLVNMPILAIVTRLVRRHFGH
jgi:hypothetical protein